MTHLLLTRVDVWRTIRQCQPYGKKCRVFLGGDDHVLSSVSIC